MQEFLAQVIVTFGDLLASLGFIVIGLLSRRIWLVVALALIWAAVAYAVRLQDQLDIPFSALPDQIDWDLARAEMPLRIGIAVAISVAAWLCMGLIIGSFRPARRRTARGLVAESAARPNGGRSGRVEPVVGSMDGPGRTEPRLGPAAGSDGISPPPAENRQDAGPVPLVEVVESQESSSNFDVVLPRDPSAAAAALRRLYGDDDLKRLLAELTPSPDLRRRTD